ncbi:MAG: helix-turn-helix transcriptional regulator [Acetobacteraceae bacterium]
MRASRLLSILLLLQTRGRMTAQALASQFEVSVRTIYRDLEQLSAAGVPLYADRGPNGGFQLLDGYRTKLTGLTPAEASSLVLAGLPGPAAELGLAALLAMAQLKLQAALPEAARQAASRVAERFHLDPVGWFRRSDEVRFLPIVATSIWDEMCLKIRYKRESGIVARLVKPLGIVLKGGTWYLVAEVGHEARSYRVANIIEASTTAERFARPKNFDLRCFWVRTARAYEAGLCHGTATLRVSPRGMTQWSLFPSAVASAAMATADAQGPNEWATVTVPIESIEHAALEFLRFGATPRS